MWEVRTFKTKEQLHNFIKRNKNKIQYDIIFVNNGFGIEYKKLIKIL